MKNILISGATSFIGKNIISELEDKQLHLIIRENNNTIDYLKEKKNIKIYSLNMDDYDKIPKKISDKIDCCFHLAWDGTRKPYRDYKDIQKNNYINSIKLFDSMEKIGCKKIIAIGSQAEYEKTSEMIYENSKTSPSTYYGIYKLKTYIDMAEKSKVNNIKFIWARVFSLYGRGDYENTLIMNCIKKMMNNEDIKLTKSIQKWNFLHVKDASRALINLAIQDVDEGIYNVASKSTKKLSEFVEDIKNITESKSQIIYGAIPYGNEGRTDIYPSIDKLIKNTKWKENITFKQGIVDIIKNL